MAEAWDWFSGLPPAVAAAIVAAIVSVLTLMVGTFIAPSIKYAFDARLENRKLTLAYQSEQRKALKDHIARHQGPFLEAAESLAYRMWNYEQNADKGWLDIHGRFSGDIRYYSKTFAYRFLLCLGSARLLEREAMFFDASVAEAKDFNFLKALKLNVFVWSDTSLFKGLLYNEDQPTDHLFRDDLVSMADSLFTEDHVVTLDEFTSAIRKRRHPYVDVFRFFDGLGSKEVRYRHDRVVAAHLILITTLNSFGYGYQRTPVKTLRYVMKQVNNTEVLDQLPNLIRRLELESERSFKVLVDEIEGSSQMRV